MRKLFPFMKKECRYLKNMYKNIHRKKQQNSQRNHTKFMYLKLGKL